MSASPKTWSPTRYPHLYRHKSGTYYARLAIGGKRSWRTLKTTVLSVAKEELDEVLKGEETRKEIGPASAVSERMTGAEAIEILKRQFENDASIKKSTRHYYGEILTALERSWPEFTTAEMRTISEDQCQNWVGKNREKMSSTRFNATIGKLKELFRIAIKRGVRRTNPAADLKPAKVRSKDLSTRLPTKEKFAAWVKAIREAGGRFSQGCADLVEFLAYTGVRIGEAKWIKWKHVAADGKSVLVLGSDTDATKNGEFRRVDLIPAACELLERLKAKLTKKSPDANVLVVREAQHAMDRAAKEVKMERITHHDLRHFFATICIESGVDIPTVSRWMGHKDGGALAMRVYGHLRSEHSQAAAARVSFAA